MPRRPYLKSSDFIKFGFSHGCPGCIWAQNGNGPRRGHDESCRKRMEEEIAKDPAVIDVVAHALQFLAFFIIGVVTWTVLEYKTHRFELHDHDAITDYMAEDKIELHHLHHMFPNQDKISSADSL